MEDILDEVVPPEDLKRYERLYNQEVQEGQVNTSTQFQYAFCLVRSKYPADIRKGIMLLEDLYVNKADDAEKRDAIYYLAIGNARIKEYTKALHYVRNFLMIEPGNQQVNHLEDVIKKRMEREGFKGLAIAGAIVGIAGILGIGIAMAKKG